MGAAITKGIILAGGTGSRLYPLTKVISKHLLPVYDKPMIYYPLSTLMLAGIRDILIITTPDQLILFKNLLGDGSHIGIHLSYVAQCHPAGLPEAYILAECFLDNKASVLILGDNIFYGHRLESVIQPALHNLEGATVFLCQVKNPSQYGVIKYGINGQIVDVIEKPKDPPSKHAITGLYICDGKAVEFAKQLKPSLRGELEIVDLIKLYIQRSTLRVHELCRGIAWLDAGTQQDLLSASQYIAMLEQRQGLKICCPEEIAWRKGYISDSDFRCLASSLKKNEYSQYMNDLLDESPNELQLVTQSKL